MDCEMLDWFVVNLAVHDKLLFLRLVTHIFLDDLNARPPATIPTPLPRCRVLISYSTSRTYNSPAAAGAVVGRLLGDGIAARAPDVVPSGRPAWANRTMHAAYLAQAPRSPFLGLPRPNAPSPTSLALSHFTTQKCLSRIDCPVLHAQDPRINKKAHHRPSVCFHCLYPVPLSRRVRPRKS
jgi:hypothetical protein